MLSFMQHVSMGKNSGWIMLGFKRPSFFFFPVRGISSHMHVARGQMAILKKRQKTRPRFCFHLGVGLVRSQRPGRKELWRRGATALLFFRPLLLFLLETTPGPQSRFPCLAGGRAVAALPCCCFEFSLHGSRACSVCVDLRGGFPAGYISSATRDYCCDSPFQFTALA